MLHIIKFRINDDIKCIDTVVNIEMDGAMTDKVFDRFKNTYVAYFTDDDVYDKWFNKLSTEADFYKTI